MPQCVQSQASAAGVVRAEPEHVGGHRDQRLQVERAGQAVADTGDGEVMPARHGGTRLIGEGFGGGSSPILTTE